MTSSTIVRVQELVSANKAKAAFLAPLLLAAAAAAANWIVTGTFDATEIRLAAGGTVLAAASSAATWFTPAGDARVAIRKGDMIGERGYSLVEVVAALFLCALLLLVVLAVLDRV